MNPVSTYYLLTIIVFQYRHCVGLRHTFHIINLIETSVLYILPDICETTVRIGSTSKIFSNNATIPCDIWSVGKEPIAMYEFTLAWHASFPDFLISLRHYTCLATAATNYPSLRDPPNGCQGHLRPCLSPPLVTEPDSNDVRTRSTFIQLLA